MFDMGISNEDVYKLMEFLTINDAGALIAGCNPGYIGEKWDSNNDIYYGITDYSRDDIPDNAEFAFNTAIKSLCHAIKRGFLKADIVANTIGCILSKDDLKKDWIATHGIDTSKTTIARDDLKEWLEHRGVYPPLLFPNGRKNDYLNPNHEHYSPKLAVCVRSWEYAQTVTPQGKTIKQIIAEWIATNGKDLGLNNTGETAIQELASIANWEIKGGRTKEKPTPPLETQIDNQEITQNLSTVHQKLVVNLQEKKIDDDIPF